MVNWIYKDKEFTSPDGYYGFIYILTFDDGTKYIGKKDFYTYVKLPALKSGKQRPNSTRIAKNKNGKRVYYDVVKKESNWRTYNSSSKLIGNRKTVYKEILALAKTKRELTYLETKYLFIYEVLETSEFLNENILGKFYAPVQLTDKGNA